MSGCRSLEIAQAQNLLPMAVVRDSRWAPEYVAGMVTPPLRRSVVQTRITDQIINLRRIGNKH